MKSLTLAVLAAGASRRFEGGDKLLADWEGRPLLEQTLQCFENSAVDKKILIVRPGAAAHAKIGSENGFEILENHNADHGLATSITPAVHNSKDTDGLMIALGDMPLIQETTIHSIVSAWQAAQASAIVAPESEGRRGHPVIFSKAYYPFLADLKGDRGAGDIIARHVSAFIGVAVSDAGIAIDFDEPADFMTPRHSRPEK